jgi:hypothetical protein
MKPWICLGLIPGNFHSDLWPLNLADTSHHHPGWGGGRGGDTAVQLDINHTDKYISLLLLQMLLYTL